MWNGCVRIFQTYILTKLILEHILGKYLGVVLQIGQYLYYVPMSSPKDSDYQIAGANKVIKKSIVPIIRIVVKNKDGEKELKGHTQN